jgi:hypothetical protein
MFSLSLSSDIYKVKISTYKKITLKFFALSLALARAGTIFPVIREITLIKKTYNFRIKFGMCKS